jgi:predicted nucleic acid-binding protein
MNVVYISDTNIWIDFRNAGLLDHMFQLPFSLCCTDFVLRELQDLPQADLVANGLMVESMDDSRIVKLFALRDAHNNSSLADVSCYLLAAETGRPLLTGDGKLRKQASKDGLQVHGGLWLLDQMVEHGVLQPLTAADALQLMLDHGARLPAGECQSRLHGWRGK